MHGYLPSPDVYIKCLCASTKFFLEGATKRNEIIPAQRPEGRLSPFARLLLPTVARWQEIPPLSLDMPLPWPLSGLQPSVIEGFSLEELHRLCKLHSPSQTRAVALSPCTAPRLTELTVPWVPKDRAFQTSSRSSTAGVETHELRKLKPLLGPEKHADPARCPGRSGCPGGSTPRTPALPLPTWLRRVPTRIVLLSTPFSLSGSNGSAPAPSAPPPDPARPKSTAAAPGSAMTTGPRRRTAPCPPRDRRPRLRRPDHVTSALGAPAAAAAPEKLRPRPP